MNNIKYNNSLNFFALISAYGENYERLNCVRACVLACARACVWYIAPSCDWPIPLR